ncbi:MAG: hypothetical protein CFE44_07470, partial [Burkholderiales bacterium PBB4]
VTIATKDVGKAGNIYLLASFQGAWYVHNGVSWTAYTGAQVPAFAVSSALESVRTLNILQSTNVSGLIGLQIFAGYGTGLEDMVTNAKYGLVLSVL